VIDGYSAAQVRAAEAPGLAAGVPLMRRAATGLARELRSLLPPSGGSILLLAGGGNNGGDALFAAAELAAEGVDVAVLEATDRTHATALEAALAAGARSEPIVHAAELAARADLILDGLLGTGTSAQPALRGAARDIVSALLPLVAVGSGPIVVAVDLPSGIHPDDGSAADEIVLPAAVTVTFGAVKAGLLLGRGAQLAGEIRLVDIGLGEEFARMTPIVRVD